MNKKRLRLRRVVVIGCIVPLVALLSACSSSKSASSPTTASNTVNSSGSTSSAATKSTYVIGSISTDTGPYASSNIGGKDGLDAWVKYTNAHGGINGHPVKAVILDNQGSTSLDLTEAQQLIEQDHVIALVANISTGEEGSVQYLSQQPVAVIGDDLASDYTTTYHNFFPEGATQDVGYFYGVPKIAATEGDTKFGAMYCDYAICSQIANAEKSDAASAGASYVFGREISATATSYLAPCLAAKASGATAVALLLPEQQAGQLAAACEQQGYHPQWLQAANGFTQEEVSTSALEGTVGPLPDFPWFASDNAAEKVFQSAMRKYEPQDFGSSAGDGYSEAAAQAWASAEIFEAAVSSLPSSETPTASDVLQAMYNLPKGDTFGGLTPPITYASSGPQPSVTCFFGVKVGSGSYKVLNGGAPICKS